MASGIVEDRRAEHRQEDVPGRELPEFRSLDARGIELQQRVDDPFEYRRDRRSVDLDAIDEDSDQDLGVVRMLREKFVQVVEEKSEGLG